MNTEAKYFAQFRGDPPTYEQAVLLSDPVFYAKEPAPVMVVHIEDLDLIEIEKRTADAIGISLESLFTNSDPRKQMAND